jgi:hypothetical protein
VLQAAEQCAPQDGGWGCKASARVRLVCSRWKCRHDALVMRLLLRQDATDERTCVLVRCGGGSLDLKCYCFNALTDEGMRVVSRRTALWGCSKVTGERMRAGSYTFTRGWMIQQHHVIDFGGGAVKPTG